MSFFNLCTRHIFNSISKFNDFYRPFINLVPISILNKIKILREKVYLFKINQINEGDLKNRTLSYMNTRYSNSFVNQDLIPGVNIIGSAKLKTGIGEMLRLIASTFEDRKLPFEITNYDFGALHQNDDTSMQHFITNKGRYNTNLFCLSSDKLLEFFQNQEYEKYRERYNIHYGAWELSVYPNQWLPLMNIVDEIWAFSSFMQKAVSEKSSCPVIHMPLPVDFPAVRHFHREYFHLPNEKFIFLFTFDLTSSFHRKNPLAVISAFRKAFDHDIDNVALVLKMNRIDNIRKLQEQYDQLSLYTGADKRIHIIDRVLQREEILGLIQTCNAYVSLHRSEGFGLGMAEAMKMGKPVIATNYSGNTDYMNSKNACLVDYSLIPVKAGEYIHGDGQIWADPDIEHAAFYLKKLVNDSSFAMSIGRNAKKHIDENYNFRLVGEKYAERLKLLDLIH